MAPGCLSYANDFVPGFGAALANEAGPNAGALRGARRLGFGVLRGTYKVSQHRFPPHSEISVFPDEHEQSINAGPFYTTQPAWVAGGSPQDSSVWWSVTADRHKQGCNLSFLDGHVEHWRWKALKVYKGVDFPASPGADLQDLLRLEEHVPHDPL